MSFLADRTNRQIPASMWSVVERQTRTIGTVLRLSACHLSVCDVMYCG